MTALITIMGCRMEWEGVSVSMVTLVAKGGGAWRNGEETVGEGGVS